MTFRTLPSLLTLLALATVGCAATNEEATGSEESNQTATNWKSSRIGDRQVIDMLDAEQVALTLDANGRRHGLYFGKDRRNHYVDFSKNEDVVIDNSGEGTRARLALDAQGQPHIAYSFRASLTEAGSQVKHAWRKNGQWTSETIGASGTTYGIGFDASGTLHIASSTLDAATVSTLKPNATAFEHTKLPAAARDFNAFSVDKNGNEYALLEGAERQSLFGRRPAGGQFALEAMDPSLQHTAGSLAIDAAGNIHAIVATLGPNPTEQSKTAPHYIHRGPADTAWSAPEKVYVDGYWSSVAVDTRGGVHVAFTGNSWKFAAYGKRNADGTWSVEDVVSSGEAISIPSLVLDASGKPAFAYRDWFGYYLAEPTN